MGEELPDYAEGFEPKRYAEASQRLGQSATPSKGLMSSALDAAVGAFRGLAGSPAPAPAATPAPLEEDVPDHLELKLDDDDDDGASLTLPRDSLDLAMQGDHARAGHVDRDRSS